MIETISFGSIDWCAPLGEFGQYDSRGVRQFNFGCFGWCAPSGSSTSATLGEFDGSNVEFLTVRPLGEFESPSLRVSWNSFD